MNDELRAKGFREVQEENAPICRWKVQGVKVDIMPIDPSLLGYSNVWYPGAIERPTVIVDGAQHARIVDAPHFCATKLEAFASRGGDDFYHHDIEDFVAIVDGRGTLVAELAAGSAEVRDFVAGEVRSLLGNERFVEALPGHLDADSASQARISIVEARLRQIVALLSPPPERRGLRGKLEPTRSAAQAAFVPVRTPRASSLPGARVPLRSSNIAGAVYDADSATLTVEFVSGGIYAYSRVPPNIFAGLTHAASVGRYHHQWIKDRFQFRKLR